MKFIFTTLFIYASLQVYCQCELTPEIQASNTLLCPNEILILTVTDTFDTYQWYRENQPIQGANQATAEVTFYDAAAATFHVEVTLDTCTVISGSVFIDGYAFLPIYFIQTGRYGFDIEQEAVVLCDSTQPGGPDTLILEVGLPYDTLITWYQNGEIMDHTGNKLIITEPGVYWATAAPKICPGFVDETLPILVIPGTPAIITIIENNGILNIQSDQELYYYQWYFNGSTIEGANGSSFTPSESGVYTVYAETRVCGSLSPDFLYSTSYINNPEWSNEWKIYPNPFEDEIVTELPVVTSGKVLLANMHGKIIRMTTIENTDKVHLYFGDLVPGTYLIKVMTSDFAYQRVVVKKR
jgi:hypothetical protein